MTKEELEKRLMAVRAELEIISVTGVRAAKSIAGMANVLDECIAGLKEEADGKL